MSGKNKKASLVWISIALLFFINPNIRIFDILPDFIACFIIARALRYGADRAPYFEEARGAFVKLGWVTLLKLPAFYLMTIIRAGNVSDNDITALLSTVFSVIEIVIFISAIKNLFSALFYLGERTNAESLISSYAIFGTRTFTPERLQSATICFVVFKLLAATLPELMLLTRITDDGAYVVNYATLLYPYVLVLAVLMTLVYGAVTYIRWRGYLKAIWSEGLFTSSLDSLIAPDEQESLEIKIRLRRLSLALTLLTVAPFLAFEIRPDTFDGVNIIIPTAFGAVMLIAAVIASRHVKRSIPAIICGGIYTAVATVGYLLDAVFLGTYDYVDISSSTDARAVYVAVIVAGILTFVTLCLLLAMLARMLLSYVAEHTGIAPTNEKYSRADKERHIQLKRSVITATLTGVLMGGAKLLHLVLRYFTSEQMIESIEGITMMAMNIFPWFGTAVFVIGVINVIANISCFSKLKEDTAMKYSY